MRTTEEILAAAARLHRTAVVRRDDTDTFTLTVSSLMHKIAEALEWAAGVENYFSEVVKGDADQPNGGTIQ